MNWKAITPLAVALALGLGAAFMARNMLTKKHVAPAASSGAQMVVAKRMISAGSAIVLDDLTVMHLDGGHAPDGTFEKPEDLVGRVVLMPIGADQPVIKAMLADSNVGSGLQALLPNGMRAITVEVNEVSGVGGLLVPGCHVDLLASINDGRPDGLVTRTLVQDIKVIAVGQSLAPAPAGDGQMARSVTLVVTPQQAQTIELASNTGRARLVLRSGNDDQVAAIAALRLSQLTGGPLPIGPASAPAPHYVTIIRGASESVVEFENGKPITQGIGPAREAGGKLETNPVVPR